MITVYEMLLQVVLKIIKHSQEGGSTGNELVQGVLLGLVENGKVEVTNCFPFPQHTDEDDSIEGEQLFVIFILINSFVI